MRPARRKRLTEADRDVWAAYARTVRPFFGRDSVAEGAGAVAPPPEPHEAPIAPAPSAPGPRRPVPRPPSVDVGTHPPGVDAATWTRLRTGRLPAERGIDLHGRTAQDAHDALQAFLRRAHADGVRCVEVVTGHGARTGGGVIRRELPLWLNQPGLRPLVLAAAHPPNNPGATRVLLRRVRTR
jgi:DNA-nicking Smr family endonuclease